MNIKTIAIAISTILLSTTAGAQDVPRAIIADLGNESSQKYTMVSRAASDQLATELNRGRIFDVIARQEVDRIAKSHSFHAPYNIDDMAIVARELDARYLVYGDIKSADIHIGKDRAREAEIGLVVRVHDFALGEITNGAAVKSASADSPNGKKSDGLLYMDAAIGAATRAALKIGAYHPIEGTIMNSAGGHTMLINKGMRDGVQKKQEFLIFRGRYKVGRVAISKLDTSYSEVKVLEGEGGVQPGDHAVPVFPDPKLR